MLRLVEKDHGKAKVLFEGNLTEVVEYLKKNEDLMNWVRDEDPGMELPELDEVETLGDLEYELKKVDLSWWTLEIEEGDVNMKKYQVIKREWNQFAGKFFESVVVKDSSKKDAETLANAFNKYADPVTEIYEVIEQKKEV